MREIIFRNFRDIKDDRRGAIIVLVALVFPILTGVVGMGLEFGLWFQAKRNLQTAADAAAIAGAYEAQESDATSASILSVATTDATRNGFDSSSDIIATNNPPSTGSYTSDTSAVESSLSQSIALLFAGVFLSSDVTVTARAVATAVPGGEEACVLSLSSSASRGISVSGGASVSMDGCQVASNSNASNSVYVSNNSSLAVDCVTTVGQVDGTEDITLNTCSSVVEGNNAITDPYADLSVPAEADTCDINSNTTLSSDRDFDASDDANGDGYVVFCGKLTVNSGVTATFDDDLVYVMNGDDLTINGGATATGENVTFIFTGSGSNANGWASANISGGATVELSAPTSGTWAGILFYQDGDAVTSSSLDMTFNGGSDMEMTGVIYVPNNDVSFTGGNSTDDNGCLQIVADEVSFGGDADLENQCSAAGVDPIYVSIVVTLVE